MGPARDLLFGCGVLFWIFFAWLAVATDHAIALLPLSLAPTLGILLGQPHYGATLLRVYEHARDRRAYAIFGIWGSILLWGLFAAGIHVDSIGSLLLTVYLTMAPWHFSAQNYGVGLMFLRRNGVEISPGAKRAFYASFVLSAMLTIASIHGPVRPDADYAFVDYQGSVYHFLSLGVPLAIKNALMLALLLGYGASLVAATVLLTRSAPCRKLAPAAAIAVTQCMWFSVPVVARHFGLAASGGALSSQHSAYLIFWVGVGHSIQYLWISTYFAARAKPASRATAFYTKAVLAGVSIFAIPTLLFAPEALGRVSVDAGLIVMVTTVVNLHHYMLDAVIWRLRSSRIASILIREQSEDAPSAVESRPRTRWVRPALVGVGAFALAIASVDAIATLVVADALPARDVARLEQTADALESIGRDSAVLREQIADLYKDGGDFERAWASAQHALALVDRYSTRWTLCSLAAAARRPDLGIEPCRTALEQRPEDPGALNNLALFLASTNAEDPARLAEAADLAHRACVATHYRQPEMIANLALIQLRAGHHDHARKATRRARTLAQENGNGELVARLDRILETIERENGAPTRAGRIEAANES